MQILLIIILMLGLLAFIIYKINDKFEIKEIVIFISVIVVASLTFNLYSKNQKALIPEMFKTIYQETYNTQILKLQSELLNNKNISSKNKFIYKFTYIINSNDREKLCTLNNVVIKKFEDELVFDNFKQIKQECKIK